jgi:hypothetical protein
MTHTLCQHQVNTYCLNEFIYSKSQICQKLPPLFGLCFSAKQPQRGLCCYATSRQSGKKNEKLHFAYPLPIGKAKGQSKGAHNFQSLKSTEQLAFHLKQSSPLWRSLYFSRYDLAFLNLKSLCSSLLKALHVCLFATLNNKRILFVGDPRPLVKEHQHKYQHCFISSQVKSLSTPMANQLPPLSQYLQKKSNFHSFFQSLQQGSSALWPFQSQKKISDLLKTKAKGTDPKIETPKTLVLPSLAAQRVSKHPKGSSTLNLSLSLTSKYLKQRQDDKKECKHSLKKPELLSSNFYFFNNLQGLVHFSKANSPFAFAKAKVETQVHKSFQNPFPASKSVTKAATKFDQTKVQSNKWMSEGFLISLNTQPTNENCLKAKVWLLRYNPMELFKNAKTKEALKYLDQKLEHSKETSTPTHAWVKAGFLQPYKSSKIDSLKGENLWILENPVLAGQADKTQGSPLSTEKKQESFQNNLEHKEPKLLHLPFELRGPLALSSDKVKSLCFKENPSKLVSKLVKKEKVAPLFQGPYDKAKAKSSAQINESNLFYISLTKLACKAAFRNSQWTAAFAQAEKGWKGGFFSNSLVSYKQNLTFSSKLNIQRVNDKDWLSLEIPYSSRSKLLYFSSKPEAGSYWNPVYFPVAKKKMTKKLVNLNEFQGFKTKSQTRSKQSWLNFSGQIPAAKKLFKKPKLFGLRSFAFKKILTQVAKTEKAHLSFNPWLKEADLVFFANPEKSAALLSQVNRLRIPSIGIVNSGENLSFPFRSVKGSSLLSSNPTLTYPIIGNSNSLNFIKMVYAKLIGVLNKKVKLLSLKP